MRKKLLTILTSVMLSALLVFAVSCNSVKFELKFMVEGEVYATVKTDGNSEISMPTNPEKEGYVFDGWYWDDGVWEKPFTANSLLDTPLSSDMSVYARFVEGHQHVYYDVEVPPTCDVDGYTMHVCTCGYSYEDNYVDKLGHKYGKWKSNKDGTHTRVCSVDDSHIETENCSGGQATCKKEAECAVCGHKYGDKAPHSFTNYVYKGDATCTKDGTETAKCDNCTATDTRAKEGSAGHSFTNYEYNEDATCEADGTETAKCDNCTATDTREKADTKLEHSFTNYAYNEDATCEADGTETAKCDNCTATDTRAKAGSKLEHSFTNYVYNKDATCEVDGTETATCDNCTATDTRDKEGSASHSFTNYEYNEDATCEADGTETAKCDNCTETDTREKADTKLEHSFTNYVYNNDASEYSNGTETAKCDNCTATDTREKEGPIKHNFTNYVYNNDATCEADGTETAQCDDCPVTDTRTKEGTKLDHSFTNYVYNNDATCEEDGTETATCDNCTETDTRVKVDSKSGHSFTNYKYNNDATCTADGTETATCDNCTETDTRTKVNSKAGHSFTAYNYNNDATCTVDGTETAKCDNCTVTDTRTKLNSKEGHSFTTYVYNEDATCTADGSETAQCDNCTETDTKVKANTKLGHSFTNYIYNEDATDDTDGTKTAVCDRNNCEERDTIAASGTKLLATLTVVYGNGTSNLVITQRKGTTLQTIVVPERAGYDFMGWDKQMPTVMPNEDTTVTAVWNAIFTVDKGVVTGLTEHGKTLTAIVLPEKIEGETIIGIGELAFINGTFESFEIPNTVQYIGESAFVNCNALTLIEIPTSVQRIEVTAFLGCTNLATVINNSEYFVVKAGSEDNGHVGYYATDITNALTVISTPIDYDNATQTFRTTIFNNETITDVVWVGTTSAKVYTDSTTYYLENVTRIDAFLSTADDVVDFFMNKEKMTYSEANKAYYNTRTVVLTNDIDMEGTLVYNYTAVWYSGTFDGRGHVLSNLTVQTKDGNNSTYGLFGSVAQGGVIKNVAFSDVKAVDHQANGAILGYSFAGLMENVYLSYSVDNKSKAGMFVIADRGVMRNVVIADNYYDTSFDMDAYLEENKSSWGVSPIARSLSSSQTVYDNVQVISRRPISYYSTGSNQDVTYDDAGAVKSWGSRVVYGENETDLIIDFDYFYRATDDAEMPGLGLEPGTATVQNTSETGKTIVYEGIRRYDDEKAFLADAENEANRAALIATGMWKEDNGKIVWANSANIVAPTVFVNSVDYDASSGIIYTTAWNGETINKITMDGAALTSGNGLVVDGEGNILGIRAKVNANDQIVGIDYRNNKNGTSNVIAYNGAIRVYTDSGVYNIQNVNYYTQLIFDATDLKEAVGYNVDYTIANLGEADSETDREKALNGKGFFVATTKDGSNYYEGVYNVGIYKMMANVDMEKAGIGYVNNPLASGSRIGGFVGKFDGNGYTIQNYAADEQGLFGRVSAYLSGNEVNSGKNLRYVEYNPTIKNLAITDVITSYYDEANFKATPILANTLGTDNYASTYTLTTVENIYVTVSNESTAAGSLVVHLAAQTKMNNVYIVNQNEFNMIEVDGLVYTMTDDNSRPVVQNGTKVWNIMKNWKEAREGVLFGWAYSATGRAPNLKDEAAAATLDNTTNVHVVSTMPINFSSFNSMFVYAYNTKSYLDIQYSAEKGVAFNRENFYKLGRVSANSNIYTAVAYAANEDVGNILVPYAFKQSVIDDAKYLLSSTEAGGLGLTTIGSYGGSAFMCNKCGEVAFNVTDRKIAKNDTCISTAECDGKYVSVDNYKVKNSQNKTGTGSFASPCVYEFTVHTAADMGTYYSHENGAFKLKGVYKYADVKAMKNANNDYSSFIGEAGNGLWKVVEGELIWVGAQA